ncbi:hypothetical protein PHYPO_G00243650 [Pangasianodon hypophthalmus]|uniref:Uncharacterized protein n=1 Tax=Pangasianodon hypophthalmus TaxID=310915 RepID=A0A5N5NGD6_PANHP|nr:hypothetical protein PHYPO_G00243650 [Pangasianodon hypophthalmus]
MIHPASSRPLAAPVPKLDSDDILLFLHLSLFHSKGGIKWAREHWSQHYALLSALLSRSGNQRSLGTELEHDSLELTPHISVPF